MKTNKFLLGAFLCTLVMGFTACNGNNPTNPTADEFDLIKVCESCQGKNMTQVKAILESYGMTLQTESDGRWLYYKKFGENHIPKYIVLCDFNDNESTTLCDYIYASQRFESREEGKNVYYNNYFPIYNKILESAFTDKSCFVEGGLDILCFDFDEYRKSIQIIGYNSLNGSPFWEYCNTTSCYHNHKIQDEVDESYVTWTTDQLLAQIKKDESDFVNITMPENSILDTRSFYRRVNEEKEYEDQSVILRFQYGSYEDLDPSGSADVTFIESGSSVEYDWWYGHGKIESETSAREASRIQHQQKHRHHKSF